MKILSIGDLHCTNTQPLNRKDDYVAAWFRKYDYLIDFANKNADVLVITGDLSDKPTLPIWLVNKLILSSERLKIPGIVIPGNHDCPGHNTDFIMDSVLWTLHKAETSLKVYPLFTQEFFGEDEGDQRVAIHTVPFGREPQLELIKPGFFNVLVSHMPVFEKEIPFYMKDGMTIADLEEKYPGYDLYLVGDIHIPAVKSKTVVSGSMMRSKIDQISHTPRFYIIDTETGSVTPHFFDIEYDVWKEVVASAKEADNQLLADFGKALRERAEKPDYVQVVGMVTDNEIIIDKVSKYATEYKENK